MRLSLRPLFNKEITIRAATPLDELGATGSEMAPAAGALGSAILTEEDYLVDMQGANYFSEIDRMRRSDSQVKAILSVLKLPILAASWRFQAATEDARDIKIAKWLTDRFMERMTTSWQSTLRHILLSLDFGVMPFEIVWEIVKGDASQGPLYSVRKLGPRLPKTIGEWRLDANGGLAGIIQNVPTGSGYEEIPIPADRLVVFTHEQEGSNFKGVSILRQARKDWYIKERLQRINVVMLEKRSAGIDVGTLGPGATNQQKNALEAALQTIRTHERAYMLETDNVAYRVEGLGQGGVVDPLPSIKYHDVMILRGVLAEFLGMGEGSKGSLAMHRDKSSFFLMTLNGIAKDITDTINRHLVPKWVALNWGTDVTPPKLMHSKLDSRDVAALADALSKLISSKTIQPGDVMEEALREFLDLPTLIEDEPTLRDRGDTTPQPEAPPSGLTAPGGDLRLRRSRSAAERLVNWISMQRGLDDAEKDIVSAYKAIQDRQIRALIDFVRKPLKTGDVVRLESARVPYKKESAEAIFKELKKLYQQGQAEVSREAASSGIASIMLADPIDPEDSRAILAFLRSRATMISSVLSERLRASLLRNGLDMIRRGEDDETVLAKALRSLSDGAIRREVQLSTSESLNLGRDAFAKKNAAFIQEVVYSSVLDVNTCGPCSTVDGESFGLESATAERLAVPYKLCDGSGRCRCLHVYTFTTEEKPRA